jgi:hypothetical protein
MDPILKELLVVFGGNAILLSGVGWLIKAVLTQGLQRDLRVFESELKAKADASIEQLKANLQIAATEHQVRFSKLHEKRGEVLADLYKKLTEAVQASQSFTSALEFHGEPSKAEKYVIAMNAIRDVYLAFDPARIYLPESLCVLMQEFIQTVRKPVISFGVWMRLPEGNRDLKQMNETWAEVDAAFDTTIPEARKVLETEFRSLLGVK